MSAIGVARETLLLRSGARGTGGTAPRRFLRSATTGADTAPEPSGCAACVRPSGEDPDLAIVRADLQPLTYSVPEVARLLGINRNTAYELAARGELPTVRLGKRVLIVRAGLERLLSSTDGVCP